jgi:tyrosinase
MRLCGRHALLLLVSLLLSGLAHLGVQAEAQQTTACPSRSRKAWGAMTPTEQSLYVEALGLGMQRGYHILFTELASEKASSTEFYRTCGFLYWNRRFVLAYENMLRSLDPKFACLTIPYWDYFADYARFLEGKCEDGGTSLEACSSILRGLGGSQGATRSVNINGRAVSGNCVTKAPANSFCESSTITTSSQCAHCIPRANWAAKTFPAGFGYAGIGVVLGEANGFREVTQGIQLGTHSTYCCRLHRGNQFVTHLGLLCRCHA